MKNKEKMVSVLSHWDDGIIGVFKTVNEAKKNVLYKRCENYRGFFKNKWGGWKCINPGCTTKKYQELEITDIIDKNKNNRLIESIINNSLLNGAEKTNLWMSIET